MKVVILCGGRGTRIRDVSELIPKPMLPIGDRPILWHIMKSYAAHGISDFVLCLGYKGWIIKEFFLQYQSKTADVTVELGTQAIEFHNHSQEADWRVTLVETGDKAATGARVWNARKYLQDTDRFCLTYGDGVGDIDIKTLVDRHEQTGKAGMITGVRPEGRFGELELEGEMVSSFNEKPNVVAGYINGGFMVFKTEPSLKYFRQGEDLNLEREVLPAMVQDEQLGVYQHDGFWQCMDTMREYTLLNEMWENSQAAWKTW